MAIEPFVLWRSFADTQESTVERAATDNALAGHVGEQLVEASPANDQYLRCGGAVRRPDKC